MKIEGAVQHTRNHNSSYKFNLIIYIKSVQMSAIIIYKFIWTCSDEINHHTNIRINLTVIYKCSV